MSDQQEFHGKIVEKGHTSSEDVQHHTPVLVPPQFSTARDSCGDGTFLFKLLNPKVSWGTFPVPVWIDNSNSEIDDNSFLNIVKDSLWEWDQFFGSNQFFKLVTTETEAKIKVGWDHLDGASQTVAITNYSWGSSNKFTRADVRLDTSESWVNMGQEVCGSTGTAFDIQNVLTHELGHAIGFDHNNDVLSCMYPSTRYGETLRRTLSLGDKKGFQELYQVQQPIPVPPPAGLVTKPKITSISGVSFLNPGYQNIDGQFVPVKTLAGGQSLPFGNDQAKIITISGKSYVYLYYYRASNTFTTLGRIPLQ